MVKINDPTSERLNLERVARYTRIVFSHWTVGSFPILPKLENPQMWVMKEASGNEHRGGGVVCG